MSPGIHLNLLKACGLKKAWCSASVQHQALADMSSLCTMLKLHLPWAWKQTRGFRCSRNVNQFVLNSACSLEKAFNDHSFSNSDWWHVLVWPTFPFLTSECQSLLPSSMARKVEILAIGIVFLKLLEEKKENTNIYSSSSAFPLLTSLSVCYLFFDTTLSFSRIIFPWEMWPLFLFALFRSLFSFHVVSLFTSQISNVLLSSILDW